MDLRLLVALLDRQKVDSTCVAAIVVSHVERGGPGRIVEALRSEGRLGLLEVDLPCLAPLPLTWSRWLWLCSQSPHFFDLALDVLLTSFTS